MRNKGMPISQIVVVGGLAKNPLYVRTHADATGYVLVLSARLSLLTTSFSERDGVSLSGCVICIQLEKKNDP
jgi:carbohydrate kinase of FGGY family protein